MITGALQIKLAIRGNLHQVAAAYEQALPTAQTRIVQRKTRQVHKGLRTRATAQLGQKAGKAIRKGEPKKPQLDPMGTVWSKIYRRDRRAGVIDVIEVFSQTQRINPRRSLYIATDAAARRAGERWRRNVTPEMFRGQLVFLSRSGRRARTGVLVHKDDLRTILFYVTGPVKLRRRFQPFARTVERQTANTADLIAKELDKQMVRRLRRIT